MQASSSTDNQVFRLARNWIDECERDHVSCKADDRQKLRRPNRLLKIAKKIGDDLTEPEEWHVRLVDGVQYNAPFAALSYCWGDPTENSFALTKATEAQLRAGTLSSDLPATLKDAVSVVRRLHLDLLWIDALCIRQDDKEDWAQESSRMRDVYRGAMVTIEAAAAGGSSEGFLKERTSSMPYCRLKWHDSGGLECVQLRPVEDLSEAQLLGSRLYSRGWTLQERLLASRTLSFGRQQTTFECMDGYREEARLLGQPTTLTRARFLSKAVLKTIRNADEWYIRLLRYLLRAVGLYPGFYLFGRTCVVEPALSMSVGDPFDHVKSYREIWATLVHIYTQRCLSKNSDRLPAISGLASEFQQYIDDTYVAGLWKSDLPVALGWMSSSLHRAESTTKKVTPSLLIEEKDLVDEWPHGIRNDTNGDIPSWSWASVRGPVQLRGDNRLDELEIITLCKLITVSMEPKFDDPKGQLSSAYIDLRAQFLAITDPQPHTGIDKDCPFPHLLVEIRQVVEYKPDRAPEFYQQHRHHDGQQFALIKLYQWKRHSINGLRLPNLQLLLIESCANGDFRRLTTLRLNYPRSEQEFVRWHMYDDIALSQLRQRQIPFDEYRRLYNDEIEEARALTAELDSPLWEERTVRLV